MNADATAPDDGSPGAPVPVIIEVTDTVAIGYTTGIQRVVRALVDGLDGPVGDGLDVIPVVRPSLRADYRRLTAGESERLRLHPPGGQAGRRADGFGALAPIVRVIGDWPLTIRVRQKIADLRRRRREFHPLQPHLALGTPRDGSVFFDVEGSWFDPEPRSQLLPRLRRDGVRCMVFVHDVMPLTHPEWFDIRQIDVFDAWLDAHLRHSEGFVANSQCTAENLRQIAAARGRPDLAVTVVALGADLPAIEPEPMDLGSDIDEFLLVVGTLEPRKNQQLVLDAFDRLRDAHQGLGLVLVGKEGWMVDDLVRRIRQHRDFGGRLLWFGGISDPQLAWLYEHAFLTIAPSRYEGLGVPVLEALHHGCATIASTGGALREAGGDAAEYIDPDDVEGLSELVGRHLDDAAFHESARERARSHRAPTWSDAAAATARAIRGVAAGEDGFFAATPHR